MPREERTMQENECPICSQGAERSRDSSRGSVVFWFNCPTCGSFAFEVATLLQYRMAIRKSANQKSLRAKIKKDKLDGAPLPVFGPFNIMGSLDEP